MSHAEKLNECGEIAVRIRNALFLLNEALADANKLDMNILIEKEINVHETDNPPPKYPVEYILAKATYSTEFAIKQ